MKTSTHPKRDLVEGVLEDFYLDIVEACVQILNKYESLFILALLFEKKSIRLSEGRQTTK